MRDRRRCPGGRVPWTLYWGFDYAYVERQQVRHLLAPRPLPTGPGDATPVVLLPGIYEAWEFLSPVAARLAALALTTP